MNLPTKKDKLKIEKDTIKQYWAEVKKARKELEFERKADAFTHILIETKEAKDEKAYNKLRRPSKSRVI